MKVYTGSTTYSRYRILQNVHQWAHMHTYKKTVKPLEKAKPYWRCSIVLAQQLKDSSSLPCLRNQR